LQTVEMLCCLRETENLSQEGAEKAFALFTWSANHRDGVCKL